jgi:hypothetical protein
MFLLLCVMIFVPAIWPQETCSIQPGSQKHVSFSVGRGVIELPEGAFLLIRKNNQYGAIRITHLDPSATDSYGKSFFESYFQTDGKDSLTAPNAVRTTGQLDIQPLKGMSVLSHRPGPFKARIGDWMFPFYGPRTIAMADASFWRGYDSDHGFEFAPTSACDPSQIDIHDKGLNWVRFSRNNDMLQLPLSTLAK